MTKKLMLFILTGMMCAASTVALAQESNPNLKTPKNLKFFLPDLVVSNVAIGNGAGGMADNVRVTVTNTCEAASSSSYVLATFKDKAGKALYYVGNTVKALKGGESQEQIFNVSAKQMPAATHVSVEVDPYKKLKEDVEGNNYRGVEPRHGPLSGRSSTL